MFSRTSLGRIVKSLGFLPTPMDPVFYYRHEPDNSATLLILVVDEISVTGTSDRANDVMTAIATKSPTRGHHPVQDFVGLDRPANPKTIAYPNAESGS